MTRRPWILGTRGSPLALAQARWVQATLRKKCPDAAVEISILKTLGDRKDTSSARQIDAKGIFTREIEEALLSGKIDMAVHSLKDLPVELPPGLMLGPVPMREDPRDVLVSLGKKKLARLAKKARVGTGSSRRALQLLGLRQDLEIVDSRGNVQTRATRVKAGGLDAVVLARAGLLRRGQSDCIAEIFEPERMLPAVGQGALAIEIRQGDADALRLVEAMGDRDADCAIRSERAFLKALGGGCRVPIGGMARCARGELTLWGGVFSPEHARSFRGMISGNDSNAEQLGRALARDLLAQGAKEVLSRG